MKVFYSLKCPLIFYIHLFWIVIFFNRISYAAFELTSSTDVKILNQSNCGSAGSFTLNAGNGLRLHENDKIRFSLTNNVRLCNKIDYFIVLCDDSSMTIPNSPEYPIYCNDNNNDTFSLTGTNVLSDLVSEGSDYVFGLHMRGVPGAGGVNATVKRLNLSTGVLGMNNGGIEDWEIKYDASVGESPDSNLYISFWDEKANAYTGAKVTGANGSTNLPGFKQKGTDASDTINFNTNYVSDIDNQDNALCLDTETALPVFMDNQYVELTPESQPVGEANRLNFTGTYRIANITKKGAFYIQGLGMGTCPDISLSKGVDQEGRPIPPSFYFNTGDYDTSSSCDRWNRWPSATPVCNSVGRGLIIQSDNNFSPNEKFGISLTLAIRKYTDRYLYTYEPTSLAWWKDTQAILYWTKWTNPYNTNCTNYKSSINNSSFDVKKVTTEKWSGVADSSFNVKPPDGSEPYTGYYTISTGNTWIEVGTSYTDMDAILIDIPFVYFDNTTLSEGDTVGVIITLSKYPCGIIKSKAVCLGNFIESPCPKAGTQCKLIFSYLTNPSNTAYWSGVSLTNLSDLAGTARMTFTDSSGGRAIVNLPMAGNAIEIFVCTESWASSLQSSTLDVRKNMKLEIMTNFKCDGLLIMGSRDFPTIYGYTSRNTCFVDAP